MSEHIYDTLFGSAGDYEYECEGEDNRVIARQGESTYRVTAVVAIAYQHFLKKK
jgi:hypothetical protein